MSVLLALLFFAIVITIAVMRSKRTLPVAEETTLSVVAVPAPKGIFVHPGHTWADVLRSDLVDVGMDRFTKSVFGSIEKLKPPKKGTLLRQGEKAWTLKGRKRELTQLSPISGMVVEVNQALLLDPKAITEKNAEKNWILKVKPTSLQRELHNLLHGDTITRWREAVKEQLVASLTMTAFPVLQEGGEIKPDLGDELTSEEWKRVVKEFFDGS